ncbi:cytosolic sulfotransferase 15-like [Henckelia pumila]|uniref:cytosolic sulfotransferase 15-like n=1 Tax=Henckelia pumila TaxID=405737 RepID=UPI003C6EA01A
MESIQDDKCCYDDESDEYSQVQELLENKTSWHGASLCKYKGFWCLTDLLMLNIRCQKYFKARNTDIILATLPKAGTTWLKALTFSIVNRFRCPDLDESPLLTSNPHVLVPFLESMYQDTHENTSLDHIPDPRIFSTHMHYKSLPRSITESKCRIIHICRNPLDQFISLWHFRNMVAAAPPVSLDEFLGTYCEGIHVHGPFWEHILEYWNAHLKDPQNVLFLKYEDLKKDIHYNVKRIAEFIGFPFTLEEEKAGLVGEITNLCSFDKLKGLEVNKVGVNSLHSQFKNRYYFRKGEIGDSANYLSPFMVESIEKVVEEKFGESGLKF